MGIDPPLDPTMSLDGFSPHFSQITPNFADLLKPRHLADHAMDKLSIRILHLRKNSRNGDA